MRWIAIYESETELFHEKFNAYNFKAAVEKAIDLQKYTLLGVMTYEAAEAALDLDQ